MELDKNKVSVVIPIYNTQKYLDKCIQSVISQSYKNLEIILVNDGSPDNALNICKEYEKKDNRIIVVDKENGGLSSARNAGLNICTGQYVMFLDSDDFLETDAIQTLLNCAINGSGITVMKMKAVDEKYKPLDEYVSSKKEKRYSSISFLKEILQRKKTCSVCDKMFLKDILVNRRFEEGVLNEDFLFLTRVLMEMRPEILEIDYYGYNYYTRTMSISRRGFGSSSRDAIYNAEKIIKEAINNHLEIVPYAEAYAAYQVRTALAIMSKEDYQNNPVLIKKCIDILKETKSSIASSFMNRKDILFCFIFPVAPKISFTLLKFIRRE